MHESTTTVYSDGVNTWIEILTKGTPLPKAGTEKDDTL